MSRRGRSGPTISLFSFQDIITSVTAIVTVITLLLALDLVQRKQSKAGDSSGNLAVELVARLAAAEVELAELNAVAGTTDDLVREVAATSPAELRNEIAERQSAIVELERERTRLERQRGQWKTREKQAQTEQFDLEPVRKQQANALAEAAELDRQRTSEQAENRTSFSLPQGFHKEGWIVVVDATQISVAPLGRPAAPVVWKDSGLPLIGTRAADAFAAWIEKEQLRSVYFLLLVRPDASRAFADTQELLTAKSISHGFDLIGSDQVILHPERGAAP
jgi:hypothetical protein